MKTASKIPSGRGASRLPKVHNLANDGVIDLPMLNSYSPDAQHGEMFLGNEASYTEETFSEPLTTYAIGYKDPENNQALVNYLAPDVLVGPVFEFKSFSNAEEFYTESDDIRATGADFKRVEYSGRTNWQNTLNKGLGFRYDRDKLRGTFGKGVSLEDPSQYENRIVAKLIRRCWRNEAVRAVTLALGAATNTAKTWSSGAPNPIADIRSTNDTAQLSSGLFNNRILWAKDAWSTQQTAFEQSNNPLGYRYADKGPQQIADALQMDKGMVSKSVYQASSASKARLMTEVVLMFYALDGVDEEDPSHLKRFWSPTESGAMRVYRHDYGKFVDIFVEYYSRIVVCTTLGMEKLTIS
jgi:hypothetical protein